MPQPDRTPEIPPGGVQTPQGASVLGSPRCEICGKALEQPVLSQARIQVTCSSRCRGIRWRRRRHAGVDVAIGRFRDGLLLLRGQVDASLRELDALQAQLQAPPPRRPRG